MKLLKNKKERRVEAGREVQNQTKESHKHIHNILNF